ncbi:MAG: energy transducer TonB [Ginsengibacter sp.]
MNNGNIAEVILHVENVPDIYFKRPISLQIRYIMKNGKLNRIIKEFYDITLNELKKSSRAMNRGNIINEYLFSYDYSTYSRVYLGSSGLATMEIKPTVISDFPSYLQPIVKRDVIETKERSKIEMEKDSAKNYKEQQNKKEDEFEIVDHEARYVGGLDSMTAFIIKNIRYPDSAYKNNIGGKISVKFEIDTDGTVKNAKVIEGNDIGYGLPEEAIRVVLSMPKWDPASIKGKPVKAYRIIPFTF